MFDHYDVVLMDIQMPIEVVACPTRVSIRPSEMRPLGASETIRNIDWFEVSNIYDEEGPHLYCVGDSEGNHYMIIPAKPLLSRLARTSEFDALAKFWLEVILDDQ